MTAYLQLVRWYALSCACDDVYCSRSKRRSISM